MRIAAVGSKIGYSFLQVFQSQESLHVRKRLSIQGFHDAVLKVHGESFVHPEVVPGGIGHKVARPGMGELMRDEARERTVAGYDRGGAEREPRIFHSAEREAWRKND